MVYETNSNNLIIENTSDGYIENIKLDGKTLVNLWGDKASDFLLSGQATFNEETGYIEVTSVSHRYSNVFTKYTEKLKPNTLYTIIVEVVENTFSNIPILRVASVNNTSDNTNPCLRGTKVINGGQIGKFVFQLTTVSDFSNVDIGLRTFVGNDNLEVGCKLKFRIIILEGNHTQNPPEYFEGIKSIGEDVNKIIVLSTKSSGNLLHCEDFSISRNGVTLTYDSINQEFTLNGTCAQDNTGLYPQHLNTVYSRLLQGSYSGRLILSNPNMANFNVRFYDKNFIRGVILNNKRLAHTGTYNNGDIVSFSVRIESGQTFNNDKFKVCFNKGDTPIPYEPYKEHKKELLYKDVDGVWKKPILREWDIIEKHDDGKWYYHKSSKQVILNGSENIKLYKSQKAQCITFEVSTEGIKLTGDQAVISNTFPYQHSGFNDKHDFESISNSGKYSNVYISILKSRLETQDVEGFKKWLKANPITVAYLAEEEIYECLPISVASYKSETTYKINSGVITPASSFEFDYSLSNAVGRISDVKAFNNAMKNNLKIHINKIREVL